MANEIEIYQISVTNVIIYANKSYTERKLNQERRDSVHNLLNLCYEEK